MRYCGFYPHKPYWAGTRPQLEGMSAEAFSAAMSEVAFSDETAAYELIIYKDGMVAYRFEGMQDEQGQVALPQCLEHLNALYLLLDASVVMTSKLNIFEFTELTSGQMLVLDKPEGVADDRAMGVVDAGPLAASENCSYRYYLGRRAEAYALSRPSEDPRIYMRMPVEGIAFRVLFDNLRTAHERGMVSTLSMFAKALSQFKQGGYEASLVLQWYLIEGYLSDLWKDYIRNKNWEFEPGKGRIDSRRMQQMQYPDAIVLNMLELSGAMPFDDYEAMEALRRLHTSLINREQAQEATEAACTVGFSVLTKLIKHSSGIVLELNLRPSV